MPRWSRPLVAWVLAAIAAGCDAIVTDPSVQIHGAIYTDFRGDPSCAGLTGPRELTGIGLTFRDGSGTSLGTTRTTELESNVVQPDAAAGFFGACRFLARYAITLPVVDVYAVEFLVPQPPENPIGGYFNGTEVLVPETRTHAQLAESDFVWTFETPAQFVVP
jgi:hypothetical protein